MPTTRFTTDDDNCVPYKKHRYDAGWDLKSAKDTFTLKAGAKIEVPTGIKTDIPRGHVGLIVPRSGLGCKSRVTLANSVGVIDSDYRGEIKVFLVNDGHMDIEIKKYDRICQLLIMPVIVQSLRRVSYIQGTDRGENGFGSTGEG